MSSNSRFIDLGDGQTAELIAHQTQLYYNPTSQQVRAIFNAYPYLLIGGKYLRVGERLDVLDVDFSARMTELLAEPGDIDPVTGQPLDQISGLGMLLLMKRAYNKHHNEEAARRAAERAEAERLAAELAAMEQQQSQYPSGP